MGKPRNMTEEELERLYTHERLAPIHIDDENNEVFVLCFDCGMTDKITVEDLLAYAKQANNIPDKELIVVQLEEVVDSINRK